MSFANLIKGTTFGRAL